MDRTPGEKFLLVGHNAEWLDSKHFWHWLPFYNLVEQFNNLIGFIDTHPLLRSPYPKEKSHKQETIYSLVVGGSYKNDGRRNCIVENRSGTINFWDWFYELSIIYKQHWGKTQILENESNEFSVTPGPIEQQNDDLNDVPENCWMGIKLSSSKACLQPWQYEWNKTTFYRKVWGQSTSYG